MKQGLEDHRQNRGRLARPQGGQRRECAVWRRRKLLSLRRNAVEPQVISVRDIAEFGAYPMLAHPKQAQMSVEITEESRIV